MNNILSEIKAMPTVIDKVHESCFRSSMILRQVLEMVKRGDSKETIFEVVEMLQESESKIIGQSSDPKLDKIFQSFK